MNQPLLILVVLILHINFIIANNSFEVIGMTEDQKQQEQREKNKFNNQTNGTKLENQNQTHNSKKEGLGQNTKR